MLLNFVRVVGLVGAFLYAVGVQALGLGDVQLNSGLNEPLDAEIKLLNTGDLNASQIIVKLASPEDFARAGAERDFFLTNFKYKTKLDGQGGGVVKITTKPLVREPYLNFLLEAKWPSGKLVREYTLLVDLPVFKSTTTAPRVTNAPAQSNTATTSNKGQSAQTTQPRNTVPKFTARDSAAGQQASTNDGTVTTRKDDTLWNLALDVRPTRSIAPQKVMVAMQALNPDAFINNNINLLKTGAVLRIPSLEDIEQIDSDRAQAAVAEQNEQWRSASESGAERQFDATPARSEPEVATAADDSGRLRLTTSNSDDATGSGGGTDSEAEGDGLAAQLLAAEESVEKANAENIELRSKVDGLEAELLELKNKLEIRDSSLANLQNSKPAPAAADVKTDAESEQAKADIAATKAPAEQAATEPDPATPPADAEAAGLLDSIMDNPLYVGGLGLLVLALLGGVFFARRRNAADEGFDVMAEFEDEDEADAPRDDQAAAQPESFAAATAEEDRLEEPQDFSEFELDSLDNEAAVESEIGDPVAEADIYMAYGRFPQAVELLNRALEQEPNRSDLRVKLIEVHMGAGARGAAEDQLTQLQDRGDAEATVQALALLGEDHATLGSTIEQPELMDEFTQMLSDNEAAEQSSPAFEDDTLQIEEYSPSIEDDTAHTESKIGLAEEDVASPDSELTLVDDDAAFAAGDATLTEADVSQTDISQVEAANEEFPGGLSLADDDFSSDTLTAEDGLTVRDGFDLELDLDDAVVNTDDAELDELALDLDMPEGDDNLDIESELSELSADFGMGDNEIGPAVDELAAADDALTAAGEIEKTAEFEPNLDLNVSDEELAELENTLTDQPPADEAHAELDLIDAADETATKIDLARAYIDMGDTEGAKDILGEVLTEAENEQLQEAQELLDRIA